MTMVQERENLAPNLDRDKNPEVRTFGEHKQKRVPASKLILMPQVRANLNPDYHALKADIRERGLLNQPDMVVLDREGLATYIDFINEVWGMDIDVADYDDQAIDGEYHLVAAGHTRSNVILDISHEDGVDHDVICKDHDTDDPYEIIAIQLAENIHSKPPQERSALAIVESYVLGLKQGLWRNEEEFVAVKGGKFSRDQVRDAVGFARLPETVRDFVFSGQLGYNAALALGRGSQVIEDCVMAELGYVMLANDKQEAKFKEAYDLRVAVLVAEVTNRTLNSTASKKFIQAKIDKMQAKTRKLLGVTDINEPQIKMATPKDQDMIYIRQLRREFGQVMQEVAARPVATTEQALFLLERLSGVDTKEAQETVARGRERLVKSMGDAGLFGDALISEAEEELMLTGSLFDELEGESVA